MHRRFDQGSKRVRVREEQKNLGSLCDARMISYCISVPERHTKSGGVKASVKRDR